MMMTFLRFYLVRFGTKPSQNSLAPSQIHYRDRSCMNAWLLILRTGVAAKYEPADLSTQPAMAK